MKPDTLKPTVSLLAKLASIVEHVEEFQSPSGHPFDHVAALALLRDPEVAKWMMQMRRRGLIPVRR